MAESTEKQMDLVVRAGRTVVVGVPRTKTNDRGETVADKPEEKSYGPGDRLTVSESEAKRLIADGAAARVGTPEALAAKTISNTIPEAFPHSGLLAKNGILTFDALDAIEDLEELEGVGAKKAEEIEDALEARRAQEAERRAALGQG